MATIRPAKKSDVPLILQLIHELAEYERAPDAVKATEADLVRDGFADGVDAQNKFRVLLAEEEGQPVGYALFFYNYSTWAGRPGIYLEDLFVRPAFRGRGIGRELLSHVARVAVEENCYGVRWEVLDWNTPASQFYDSLGAVCPKEWLPYKIKGEALRRLADSSGE